MMHINILAFGIAKDIVGGTSIALDVQEAISVGELKAQLIDQFPDFSKLASLALAVNGTYVEDGIILKTNDEIVIIPPVSGG